ncbi:hypothetical protein [Streptomyces cyslabdanicus]
MDLRPEADPEIVLPAIPSQATGWSTIPEAEVLDATDPGSHRPDRA